MELSEQELTSLQNGLEILDLQQVHAWQLFRKRIENAIAAIMGALAQQRQLTWDAYLCLWYRKEALESTLNDFDHIKAEVEALQKKAATPVATGPATGELA